MVEHCQARLTRGRGDRVAIERVLADVEVESGELAGHEGVESGENALVVEIGVGLAHEASEFDILRPSSSSTKPCVSTTSKGARARVPQDSSSEDWNQPRCWSEPSRYMTVSGPPSRLRLIPASEGKCAGSSKTKAWVEPESHQTSRMSSTFCQSSLASSPRKRSRAPG